MSEANQMKLMNKIYTAYNRNEDAKKPAKKPRRTRSTTEVVTLGHCPCSVDEVYSLGVSLQYCIGDIYLQLETMCRGDQKIKYKNLALLQLDIKEEIEKLANENLNKLWLYFYNNGGPVIQSPVSEKMAREIQPFFNRIASNFLNQVNVLVSLAAKRNMNASELESAINNNVIDMYTTMAMLFRVDEIQDAFDQLINVRRAVR